MSCKDDDLVDKRILGEQRIEIVLNFKAGSRIGSIGSDDGETTGRESAVSQGCQACRISTRRSCRMETTSKDGTGLTFNQIRAGDFLCQVCITIRELAAQVFICLVCISRNGNARRSSSFIAAGSRRRIRLEEFTGTRYAVNVTCRIE